MQNPKPAPFNVVPEDPTGITWALPEGAIARFGKGFQDYQRDSEIGLSPDGTYFVVGTRLGLWWYDISSMSPIALWETERGMISAVDISPDSKWVAIANWDGIIKVRDIQSGECITQIKRTEEHTIYEHITFSQDSSWIAIANRKGIIEVLDVQNGECIAQMNWNSHEEQSNYISQLEFSPDGQYVAATTDKHTSLWNPTTGAIVTTFEGRNFAFSPDSRLIACQASYIVPNANPARAASFISIWNIATGACVAHFTEHSHLVTTIIFSPCGQFLASRDRSSKIHVWNLTKGVIKEVYEGYGFPFYFPDGTLLATVFTRETIEVWNVAEREKLCTYERKIESIGDKWFSKCPNLVIAHTLSNKGIVHGTKVTFSTLQEPSCFPRTVLFFSDGEMLATIGTSKGIVL